MLKNNRERVVRQKGNAIQQPGVYIKKKANLKNEITAT